MSLSHSFPLLMAVLVTLPRRFRQDISRFDVKKKISRDDKTLALRIRLSSILY